MKSEHRNKNNPTRVQSTHNNNPITYASSNTYNTQHKRVIQTTQQQLDFHLHDEQPQSLNAKRKLEQFSVSLNEQKLVNLNKRNHHTVNLLKKKTIKTEEHENQNIGWTDNQINIKQQSIKIQQKDKNSFNTKKLYSPTRNQLTRTLQVNKQKPYKQSSFTSNCFSPQRKLNLSFNNLVPNQMQIIRQQQLSRQLIKKVKNAQSTKRPTTASYFAASQKILTLYQKDKQSGKLIGQTMRIHSVKDSQLIKMNNMFSLKDNKERMLKDNKERMLKTCTVNSFYGRDNSSNDIRKNSKFGNDKSNGFIQTKNINNNKKVNAKQHLNKNKQRLSTQQQNNQNNIILNKQLTSHYRTYSQPIESECRRSKHNSNNTNNSNNNPMTLSHRKYQLICDKKSKRLNKIDKNIQASNNNNSSTKSNNKNNKDYIRSTSNSGRRNCLYQQQQHQQLITSTTTTNTTTNNLQQDFTLLTNLLKKENQHIFGGQLHNYLTQVKNNYQYNYYMSSTVNKKNLSKNLLNQSLRVNNNRNKKKTTIQNNLNINSNNNNNNSNITIRNNQSSITNHIRTNDDMIDKNNTFKHYKPFSASKHRSKTNNFLISSSQLIYQ